MYKIYTWNLGIANKLCCKILLYMRLTTVIILASLLQLSAATFGQRINLSESNVTLKSVLKEIRRQSNYDFYYDGKLVSDNQKISVFVKDATLQQALNKALGGLDLSYEIEGKTVSIVKRTQSNTNENKQVPQKRIDVKGRIVDSDGKPLPGASIRVVGTDQFTASNENGSFMLKDIDPGAELEIIFVGYVRKRFLAKADLGTIVLEASNINLQEVTINTGFQMIKKEKITGATVTVTSQELEKRYTPNILDNLEGRVPGLVNYRGTTTVRGVSTFNNGARSPLYVVDGLPIDGSVANINPYDVETITVLKDAAAAAIYGVRASNGVIVITTKRAKKVGTTIEFATDVTITDKTDYDKFNYMTAAQQVDVENAYASWLFTNPTSGAANITTYRNRITQGFILTPIEYLNLQLAQNLIPKTQVDAALAGFRQNDFRKEFTEKALLNQLLQQYNLAIRTGSDKFQSSLLLNYKTNNQGIINAYNRELNIFYKGGYKPLKWLEIGFGINTVLGKQKESNSNFATTPNNVSPYLRLENNGNREYYTTGDYNPYNTLNSTTTPQLQSMLVNHLDELQKDSRATRRNFGRYFVNLKANIIDGLSFSPQFQYENNSTTIRAYSESDSYAMRYLRNAYTTRTGTAPNFTYNYLVPQGGRLAGTQQNVDSWTARGQFDYVKQLNKHEIAVLAGTEFRESLTKGARSLLLGYDDQLQSQSMNSVNFGTLSALSTSSFFKPGFNLSNLYNTNISSLFAIVPETKSRSNSLYANATYTYDGKYNLFGSFRKDYADAFGLDKKFRGKPLWSTGVAWIANKEEFLTNLNWITFLKLRASYGITGNIAPGLTSLLVANSAVPANATTQLPVSEIQSSANPQLRWEKTATANFGLDFAFFGGRLNGALDIYRKKGSDILSATRIDPSEGFLSQIINNGDLLNNGIELNLQYQWFRPSKAEDFGWSSNLVLSKNSNRITYVDQIANTPQLLTEGGLKTGYPVQSLFSYQHGGLNAVGQSQWLKADGTLTTGSLTSADINAIVFSGGIDPKINVTLINEFTYKGFSLNILSVYYGGHFQRALQPSFVTGASYGPLPSYTLDAWTPTNTNTYIPGYGQYAAPGAIIQNQVINSDVFVRPSDFIKIRSVGLGYKLPRQVAGKLGGRDIGFRFQLNNPKALWIKNNVGIDPETGTAPVLTSYVFGLNFNL